MVISVKLDGFPPPPKGDTLAELVYVIVRLPLRLFLTIKRSICSRCLWAYSYFSVIIVALSAFETENYLLSTPWRYSAWAVWGFLGSIWDRLLPPIVALKGVIGDLSFCIYEELWFRFTSRKEPLADVSAPYLVDTVFRIWLSIYFCLKLTGLFWMCWQTGMWRSAALLLKFLWQCGH